MIETPVVLIIFRRPDLTARVLKAIGAVRPRTLLVVADGPRPDRPDDADACAAARAVIDRVDWDCEVVQNYSDVNLGCGRRPATGISWALDRVGEAIILEDDCVPHPTFFQFCEEMLARYRDDERVVHIGGSTYQRRPIPTPYSYAFSQYPSAWGWATWRRAWRHFDASLKLWSELRKTSWLKDIVGDERAVRYWSREFETAFERDGNVSYWDHQWTFACWASKGLSIAPRLNLVSNIGCGPDGTHTLSTDDPIGNVPAQAMTFPLEHPPHVIQNREWDRDFLRGIILPRLEPPTPSRLRVAASRFAPGFVKRGYRHLAAAMKSFSA
jgi:hypothetical protein